MASSSSPSASRSRRTRSAAMPSQYGLDYDIGLDSTGAIARTYGVFGIPTHYFVDPNGIIRDRSFGPLSRTEMERRLATILPTAVAK